MGKVYEAKKDERLFAIGRELAMLRLSHDPNWLVESSNIEREAAAVLMMAWRAMDEMQPGAIRYGDFKEACHRFVDALDGWRSFQQGVNDRKAR